MVSITYIHRTIIRKNSNFISPLRYIYSQEFTSLNSLSQRHITTRGKAPSFHIPYRKYDTLSLNLFHQSKVASVYCYSSYHNFSQRITKRINSFSKLGLLLFARGIHSNIMPVKVKENNIISSPEDKRLYRGLILENGLKVMLISDPTTDKSAAALDVNVGSLSDPWELPGLAHFCEHMLFMGTEKYPFENDYNKYLSEHGGGSNAYTASDHTNYYFDVTPDAFPGALDRFAQFFICPLFTADGVDREVKAVNSEHEKNLQNDYWRLAQVEKETSNPNHDFSKFGTGNYDTLDQIPKEKGVCVRDALLEFHKQYYSANIMALAVLGKETLDELEEMVLKLFSDVGNHDVAVPEWAEHPFTENERRKLIYVSPVKDIRKLNITFPVPDLRDHYKTSPGHYLGHLIGHEGPGSLLSYLKGQGWVSSVLAGQHSGAKGFGFFVVNVDLTEEGISHVNDITKTIFQYLKFLKEKGPQKWIFEECSDLSKMSFRFKDKEFPQSYVSGVAELLHYYPLAETLSAEYILTDFKPELISSVLDCLCPDNIRMTVVGKAVADKANVKEKWYKTDYKIEDLDPSLLTEWSSCEFNDSLDLPPKNEFVPTDFALAESSSDVSDVPTLISETPLARVWFKQDDEFKLPKNCVFIEFFSRIAYLDPLHTNLLHMFVSLFKDALTEYSYAAELAGLHYNLHNTKYGLTLNVMGYSDKQEVLLLKIVDKMASFKIDPKRFEIIKETYVRSLKNFFLDQPHQHLVYYTSLLLSEVAWTKEELLQATEELTVDKLEAFIPKFLSNLHLEFLIHGNVTRDRAEHLADTVTSKLTSQCHTKPLLPSQLSRQREYQLPIGCSFVYNAENCVHKSSAIEAFYQCEQMNTRENVLAELLVQVLREPCFDELRTKEQLGYIVWCGLRRSNGTQGLRLIVQGEKAPEYLDARIETFLNKMKTALLEMPESEFLCHRDALAKRRLEKPKKLTHLSTRWWSEIVSNQYHFNRDKEEVDFLLSQITKEDLITFYDRFILCDSADRKKLAVRVISTAPGGAGDPSSPEYNRDPNEPENGLPKPPSSIKTPEPVKKVTDFKCSLPLFPLMKPRIPISLESNKSKL